MKPSKQLQIFLETDDYKIIKDIVYSGNLTLHLELVGSLFLTSEYSSNIKVLKEILKILDDVYYSDSMHYDIGITGADRHVLRCMLKAAAPPLVSKDFDSYVGWGKCPAREFWLQTVKALRENDDAQKESWYLFWNKRVPDTQENG